MEEQHTFKSEFCVVTAPKHWPTDPQEWTSVAFNKMGGMYYFADLEDLVYFVKVHTNQDVTAVAEQVRKDGQQRIVYGMTSQWQISKDIGEHPGHLFKGDPSRPDLISVQEQRRMALEGESPS
jgi:hypothetical protein